MKNEEEKEKPEDYIKTSLIFTLYVRLTRKEHLKNFESEIKNNLELRKTLYARAGEILREFESHLITKELIITFKRELKQILKERRWLKATLAITQGVGLTGAGLLLKNYKSLPSHIDLALGLYCAGVVATLFLGLVEK